MSVFFNRNLSRDVRQLTKAHFTIEALPTEYISVYDRAKSWIQYPDGTEFLVAIGYEGFKFEMVINPPRYVRVEVMTDALRTLECSASPWEILREQLIPLLPRSWDDMLWGENQDPRYRDLVAIRQVQPQPTRTRWATSKPRPWDWRRGLLASMTIEDFGNPTTLRVYFPGVKEPDETWFLWTPAGRAKRPDFKFYGLDDLANIAGRFMRDPQLAAFADYPNTDGDLTTAIKEARKKGWFDDVPNYI